MPDFSIPDIDIESAPASTGLLGATTIVANTYKDQAYRLIKDAIIYKKLKLGNVYSQDALCSELGISRTPVREALLELQKEGYINILRGKGIQIVPVTKNEALDIIEMRFYIESIGAQLAAVRRTENHVKLLGENIAEMKALGANADFVMLYRLDRLFHLIIFDAAQNMRMQSITEQLRDHFLRVENQDAFTLEPVLAEHEAIYQAIKAGNPHAAKDAMVNHMENSKNRTMTHIISDLPDLQV